MKQKQRIMQKPGIFSFLIIVLNLIILIGPNISWAQITTSSHLGSPITITGLPDPVCGDEVAVYTCKDCFCCYDDFSLLEERIQTALENAPVEKRIRVEYDKPYDFVVAFGDLDKDVKFSIPEFYRDNDNMVVQYFDAWTGVDGNIPSDNLRLVEDPNETLNEGVNHYSGSVKFAEGTKDGYLVIRYKEFGVQTPGHFTTVVIIPFVVEGPTEINKHVKIIDTIQEPQLPYLVLHAPPGDQSFTEFKSDKTTCRQIQTKVAESQSHNANLAVKLGVAGELGLFVTTKFEFSVTFSAGFETGDMLYKQTQDQTCITVSEGFKTNAVKVDKGIGDVFIGYGSDLALGFYPLIYVDEATCSVVSDSGLIYGRIENSLREFALTSSGIKANIAELNDIVADSSNLDSKTTNNAQNQIDVWNQVLAMNIANIDNPANQSIGSRFELRNGVEKFRQENISITASNTIEYEQYIQAKVGVQAKLEVAGSGVSGGYEYKAATKFGKTQNQSDNNSNMVKYTLKDDDPGDKFNIQIVRDPMFGTPIFRLEADTRSSCPYQGGYLRDQPKLTFADDSQEYTLSDIPNGGTGTFQIKICNDSDEDRTYYLLGNSTTNLDGAIVEGFGNNLFNTNDDGIEFYLIPANECLNVANLSIKQANTAIRDYENIELYLNVKCQPATAPILSSIFLSAHFAEETQVSDLGHDEKSISIIPNPNNGLFNVQIDSEIKEGQLSVLNLNGKKLYQKSILKDKTFSEIDLRELSSGVYILIFQNKLESISKKLIIK